MHNAGRPDGSSAAIVIDAHVDLLCPLLRPAAPDCLGADAALHASAAPAPCRVRNILFVDAITRAAVGAAASRLPLVPAALPTQRVPLPPARISALPYQNASYVPKGTQVVFSALGAKAAFQYMTAVFG
jgi:hypothetical protein